MPRSPGKPRHLGLACGSPEWAVRTLLNSSTSHGRLGFTVTRSTDGGGRPHAGRALSHWMAPAKVALALEEAAATQAVTQGADWEGSGGGSPPMASLELWGGRDRFSPFCK